MTLNLNPQQRSNPNVHASTLTRIGSPQLTAGDGRAAGEVRPGFGPFTGGVTQFVNAGELDYDALLMQLKKRFTNNYSAQVSYTLGNSRGNTSGNGAPAATSRLARICTWS